VGFKVESTTRTIRPPGCRILHGTLQRHRLAPTTPEPDMGVFMFARFHPGPRSKVSNPSVRIHRRRSQDIRSSRTYAPSSTPRSARPSPNSTSIMAQKMYAVPYPGQAGPSRSTGPQLATTARSYRLLYAYGAGLRSTSGPTRAGAFEDDLRCRTTSQEGLRRLRLSAATVWAGHKNTRSSYAFSGKKVPEPDRPYLSGSSPPAGPGLVAWSLAAIAFTRLRRDSTSAPSDLQPLAHNELEQVRRRGRPGTPGALLS
jgi:hypothetical protein